MECRAGTIYLSASLEWMAGLYRFFFSLALVVAGTVRLKWWGGVPSFLLSLVCCQFSWRLDVCGRISVLYNLIFFGRFVVFRDFVFDKSLIVYYLLQVVSAQSELGGGPGTSA